MRKIKLNVDRRQWPHKPCTESEKALAQSRLITPEVITVKDLAEIVTHGGNFRQCCNQGGCGDKDFISSDLAVFDTDNESETEKGMPAEVMITPEEVRDKLASIGVPVALQYSSPNSTPEWPRFRTVTVYDRTVCDIAQHKAVLEYLASQFDECHCDRNALRASNIFYGSYFNVIYADYEAVLSTDALLSKIGIDEVQKWQAHYNRKSDDSGKKSRTKRTSVSSTNEADQSVIDAIRTHDWQAIRTAYGVTEKTVFRTRKEFFDYIYGQIELDTLLGVEAGKSFRCILPKHNDKNPSANIFVTQNGTWQYKCFTGCMGSPTKLNLKQLCEVIGQFPTESASINFIKQAFNLEIEESEWAKSQRQNIDLILDCLVSRGEDGFMELCPQAEINTRHAYSTYVTMLLMARELIPADREGYKDEQVIFFCTVAHLASKTGKTIPKTQAYIKMLIYHKMLEICPEDEIPPRMKKLADDRAIKAWKMTGKSRKRMEFYRIPSWIKQRVDEIKVQGDRWKQCGYRVKSLSYEMFYRTEGEEVARWLYPQHAVIHKRNGETTTRTTSRQSDERHEAIAMFVTQMIDEHGYCTEQMIRDDETLAKAFGKRLTDAQIQRSIKDICDSYGLVKRRANKALKQKYNIQMDGYPNVIVRE